MKQLQKTRSTITIDRHKRTVTKRYKNLETARTEIRWYQTLDYGHPQLLDADPDAGIMITRYHAPCTELPNYRPIRGLIRLLKQLQTDGIHHRDVHIENIVQAPQGPLLIDWETGIHQPGHRSYDLYGPDESGVPAPDIHLRWPHYRMWIGSDHRKSVKTVWNLDELPALVG